MLSPSDSLVYCAVEGRYGQLTKTWGHFKLKFLVLNTPDVRLHIIWRNDVIQPEHVDNFGKGKTPGCPSDSTHSIRTQQVGCQATEFLGKLGIVESGKSVDHHIHCFLCKTRLFLFLFSHVQFAIGGSDMYKGQALGHGEVNTCGCVSQCDTPLFLVTSKRLCLVYVIVVGYDVMVSNRFWKGLLVERLVAKPSKLTSVGV